MDKNTQEILDAGSDILKSVTKAIDTNDYSKLASEISRTVKSVSIQQRTTYASGRQPVYTYQNKQPRQRTVVVNNTYVQPPKATPFFQKRVSKGAGIALMTIAGFSELFIFLPLLGLWAVNVPAGITGTALAVFGGFLTFAGYKRYKLAKKFHQYGNILGNAEYFAISDLAKAVVKSDAEVRKDIKDMISAGFLPRAKMDATESTCMITDAAYQMYLGAETDRIAREQRQAKEAAVLNRNQAANDGLDPKVREIIKEGNEYITFVRQINDLVPDTEEMSNKLYKLESIMNKIFEQVKKEPGTADDLHKLMNYYLPTTKKLLTAYVELDKQAGLGENVQQTKAQIDSAMDTINSAFENLLDSLFQDMAWDIASDISVMKTMMAQDGLTSDGGPMATQIPSGGQAMAQAQPQVMAGGMAMAAQAQSLAGSVAAMEEEAQQGIKLEFGQK